jgi:RNA polymerase sigma factor (sigma-70 family)
LLKDSSKGRVSRNPLKGQGQDASRRATDIDYRKAARLVDIARDEDEQYTKRVDAFAELYRLFYPRIYYASFKLLGDHQNAGDATQETFLRAWTSLSSLKDAFSFHKWLQQIAYNKSMDLLAEAKRKTARDYDIDIADLDLSANAAPTDGTTARPAAPTAVPDNRAASFEADYLPETVLETAEDRQLILGLIDKLSPLQRATIIMRYFDELTIPEIAQATSTPSATIRKRLFDAHSMLKSNFERARHLPPQPAAAATKDRQAALSAASAAAPVLTRLFQEDSQLVLSQVLPHKLSALPSFFGSAFDASAPSMPAAAPTPSAPPASAGSTAPSPHPLPSGGAVLPTGAGLSLAGKGAIIAGAVLLATGAGFVAYKSTRKPQVSTPRSAPTPDVPPAQTTAPATSTPDLSLETSPVVEEVTPAAATTKEPETQKQDTTADTSSKRTSTQKKKKSTKKKKARKNRQSPRGFL